MSSAASASTPVLLGTHSVFVPGKLKVEVKAVSANESLMQPPPVDVTVASPTEEGPYPVVVFLHGFALSKDNYRQLHRHVASHGYIIVAPQSIVLLPFSEKDITDAAATADWLPVGLERILPNGTTADLTKVALVGHSRGGHAAFSLALGRGATTSLKFSALVGINPVAGVVVPIIDLPVLVPPNILTREAASFDVDAPVLVVGSGLGKERKWGVLPACGPRGLNHEDFYYHCEPPCYHFVLAEHGHMDVLDDDAPAYATCACTAGKEPRDVARRCVGGLVVAFLRVCFQDDDEYLDSILADPDIAPAKLHPIYSRK